MADKRTSLTGRHKAAALLIALGSDACAEVFKVLKDAEVEQLASTIAKMQNIDAETMTGVVAEFNKLSNEAASGVQGGIPYATEVLNKALGAENSSGTIERINSGMASLGLLTSSPSSTELLLEMIREEHPQTIALILVHIQEQRAAEILAHLPSELQTEVIMRIANMTAVSPEVVEQIEEALRAKSQGNERVNAGGARNAAEILNRAEVEVEKYVMESITDVDPELAEEISDYMFTYDDIALITDAGIQKLLQDVNENDLLMALRASTELIKNKFLNNVSERRRESIKGDLETLPPVRLKDALAAQKRILTTAKEMSQSGKIEIIRETEEDELV